MMRNMLAGVAALALISGAAVAQDNSYSSQTTTTTVAPTPAPMPVPDASFSRTTTERAVTPNGTEVERTQSVQKNQAYSPNGDTTTTTTKTQTNTDN